MEQKQNIGAATRIWSAIVFVVTNLFRFHFAAVGRLILGYCGWRRTYLVHANVFIPAGRIVSLSFVYSCKPWVTVYHLPEIESLAAKSSGMIGPNTRVTIVSLSRIGNP